MDEQFLRAANAAATAPIVAALASALSSRWLLVIFVPLIASWIRRWRGRAAIPALALVLALAAADQTAAHVIKPWVARPRPCRALSGLVTPQGCGPGMSFPSNHAGDAFALSVVAAAFTPAAAYVLLPLSALVALSRVVLGLHYPSDVLGGALLGAAIGGLIAAGARALGRRAQN